MTGPVLVWLALALIWSSTWIFIKLGLRDLPPITFAGLRFVVAALVLVAVVTARRVPWPRERRDWTLIAYTGLLSFTLNYGLLFWGEQRTSSGLAAILQATIPVFGLGIAHRHLPGERITAAKVGGLALAIAGLVLIFSDQIRGGAAVLAGSAAIVLGAVCVAYANVLIKVRLGHLDAMVLAAGQMACGLVPLLVVGFAVESSPFALEWTPLALGCLLYLALVGSCLAFTLYYWLVKRMDVTHTMLIALVTPVLAVVIGMLVLDESLTWRVAAGGAAILSGIALNVWSTSLRRLPSPPPELHA